MRTLSLVWCAVVVGCSVPGRMSVVTPADETRAAAAGVGVCHWIAPDGLPDGVNWGTETTRVTHWGELEPWPDVYYWDALDGYVRARQGDGVGVWLAIQTMGAGVDGEPKAPQWLFDQGAVWHTAGCGNERGVFANWDPVYLRRLEVLLSVVNDHISAQDAEYQNTIAGIVMMAGGPYGETHLYEWDEECSLEMAIRDYYELRLTDAQFDDAYGESVVRILDRYMTAFDERWPVMVQLGRPSVDEPLLWYGWNRYGGRLYAKWQGWAPTNVGDGRDAVRQRGNEYYGALFRGYQGLIHCGFEPGHPVEEWLGPEQYLNAMGWAVAAEVSFVCLQAGETLLAGYALETWAAFDAELEANAARRATSTPMPTQTGTPTPRSTETRTPTPTSTHLPTPTSTPTRTYTPTSTPTHSPTPSVCSTPTVSPTPEPAMILYCECRPVTVTPSP